MPRSPWIAIPLLVLLAGGSLARASKPRCKLERIDPTPLREGRLRLYASALELEGDVIDDLAPPDFTLLVDGKAHGKPERAARFSEARETVDIVLIVEVAAQFKQAIEPVKAALKEFLEEQPPSLKLLLLTYGESVETLSSGFQPAAALVEAIDGLAPEDSAGDVAMTDALTHALRRLTELDKSRAAAPGKGGAGAPPALPPRRLIVLISDGLNVKMDRLSIKQMGDQAARARIPIHTIGFSPIDSRGPLLNLGDLSKRSGGTFRWAREPGDIKHQLDTLADEVRRQYVLTFKTDLRSLADHSFGLVCRDLRSNLLSGQGLPLAVAARRGLAWYWWLAIGLGGALVLTYLVGLVLLRRERARTAAAPLVPGVAATAHASAAAGGSSAPAAHPVHHLEAPAAAPSAQEPAAEPRRAVLIAVAGVLAGQRFPVSGPLTIGRGAQNHIDVGADASVSRRHCELRPTHAGHVLADLGSTAGTWLNGQRLQAPHPLTDGDLVRLGEHTQFKYRIE